MPTYKPIRSLRRALHLLSAINQRNGSPVQALAESTGLHRATVHRILHTLEDMGYVRRSPSDDGFRLTPAVRQLSDGLDDAAWVSAVAGPVLRERHPRILWPMNVATFDYDAMLIRESSHRYSPFAIHHAVVGQRLPMLDSVLGQAYVAFCPDEERREILVVLRAGKGRDAALARDETFVRDMVRRVRSNGYASKLGLREKRIAAIGVPVMRGGRVFATLNMLFFRSALAITAAADRYLAELLGTATAIAAGLGAEDVPGLPGTAGSSEAKGIPESPGRPLPGRSRRPGNRKAARRK